MLLSSKVEPESLRDLHKALKTSRIITLLLLLFLTGADALAITCAPKNASTAFFGVSVSRARYYKPDLGRFWTMDSYEGNENEPQSLHKYLYCYANPVNNLDPSGKFTTTEVMVSTTISVGLSLWVNAQIIRTGVAVKQATDVQALAQRLGVQVKESEDDPQYDYFLHGTSLRTWGPSVRIDPDLGAGRDFGRGFYTFADDQEGRSWSGIWARRSAHGMLDVPIVIVVKIPKSEFGAMSKKDFRDPALAPAWQPFVKVCRDGQRNYGGAGVIIGPVSDGNNSYPQVHPEIRIPQYKFESGASRLKFAYIYPAWGALEAGL